MSEPDCAHEGHMFQPDTLTSENLVVIKYSRKNYSPEMLVGEGRDIQSADIIVADFMNSGSYSFEITTILIDFNSNTWNL